MTEATQTAETGDPRKASRGARGLAIRNAAPTGVVRRGVSSSISSIYLPWGADNRYPQRVLDAVAASSTAAVCVALKAKFIEGNGLKDADFYKAVINRKGETVDQLLRLHSTDISALEGIVALVNFNAAGYPCEVYFINIAPWRPGVANEKGLTTTAFILENTAALSKTNGIAKTAAKRYNKYDPKEKAADRVVRITDEMRLAEKLFTDYPGELAVYFHAAPGALNHPRPAYDCVLRDILSEAALKVARHVDIRNGFAAQVMVTEYGTADPDDEKLKNDEEKYGDMIGEDAGRMIIQYAQNKESKPDVDALPAPDASKRYATDEESIRRNVRAAFQLPELLYGEPIAGKLGTSQEFDDALNYVQRLVVNRDQRAISQFYEGLFAEFQSPDGTGTGINPSGDYSIQNLSLRPAADVPTETENILAALAGLDALVANKVLDQMTPEQILSLVGLKPATPGTTATPAVTTPANA